MTIIRCNHGSEHAKYFISLQGVDDGLIGEESPYFGKGRFHKNMNARESVANGKGHAVPLTYGNVNGGRTAPVATANHEAMHASLDKELVEKRRAIEHGT